MKSFFIEHDLSAEYSEVWKRLEKCVKDASEAFERIEAISQTLEKMDLLSHFPNHILSRENRGPMYLRNLIGRSTGYDKNEALLIHWNTMARTGIHGHPAAAFYRVLTGKFQMDVFERIAKSKKVVKRKTFILGPGDSKSCIGTKETYDNFIHRVVCLEEGFTVHFYSDDARKGEMFELPEENTSAIDLMAYKFANKK